MSIDNISLRLIGCPLVGYGSATGAMSGEIAALFYRYKSVGGFEYVADFLIGPRQKTAFSTRPGDSGTLWLMEVDKDREAAGNMPIAIQWGGHVFTGSNFSAEKQPYALATCLSTVCNLLEVDLVRDWNVGLPDYWGAVGHYSIANKACSAISDSKLKALMQANLTQITFPANQITDRNLSGLSKAPFVPLADVPDLVWKRRQYNRGGPEHPNHFADMDKKLPLAKLCSKSARKIARMWL